jgi:hypothetical protein
MEQGALFGNFTFVFMNYSNLNTSCQDRIAHPEGDYKGTLLGDKKEQEEQLCCCQRKWLMGGDIGHQPDKNGLAKKANGNLTSSTSTSTMNPSILRSCNKFLFTLGIYSFSVPEKKLGLGKSLLSMLLFTFTEVHEISAFNCLRAESF